MAWKYVGIGTFDFTIFDLKESLTLLKATIVNHNNKYYKFVDKSINKALFLPVLNVYGNINRQTLDAKALINGKDRVLPDGKTYHVRSLTGFSDPSRPTLGGEISEIINELNNQGLSHGYDTYCICKEAYATTRAMARTAYEHKIILPDRNYDDVFWRPALITDANNAPVVNTNKNLGDVSNAPSITFTVSDADNENLNITVTLNGTTLYSVSNVSSPHTHTVSTSGIFDRLDFKKHIVTISVSDGKDTTVTEVEFTKIKEVVRPLSTNATLEDYVLKNKEVNDYTKYLKSKLRATLQDKGINVSNSDDLTALISFVEKLPSNSLRTLVANNVRSIQEANDSIYSLETTQKTQGDNIVSNMLATTEIFEMILSMSTPESVDINTKTRTKNLGGSNMVLIEVYVSLILAGEKTIEEVPKVIRDKVQKQLEALIK